jgi:hypothetical protein
LWVVVVVLWAGNVCGPCAGNRDSGTENTNGAWLWRLVGPGIHLCGFIAKTQTKTVTGNKIV